MRPLFSVLLFVASLHATAQQCYTISNRTNGNGNPGTCGTPNCSGNSKTGHIEVNFGASCPGIIPTLQLISVTSGLLPSPFCFDPGNCLSPGVVRYCFRGSNLPNSGSMVLRLTQGATVWNCTYDVNGGAGIILPVQLAYFNATIQSDHVLIQWRTEQESNNEKFEIERSQNNRDFSVIGTVAGQGNSSVPLNYQFTDAAPLNGISFYRLKQVDADGRATYSSIKRVDNRMKGIRVKNIYPNPVHDDVNLAITADKPLQLVAKLFNSAGKQIVTRKMKLVTGEQFWHIDLPYLSAGVYEIVVISDEGGMVSEKIIVSPLN